MTAEPVFEDGLWLDGDEAWTEKEWAFERARRGAGQASEVQRRVSREARQAPEPRGMKHTRIHFEAARPGWIPRYRVWIEEALTLVGGIALIVFVLFFATWTGH